MGATEYGKMDLEPQAVGKDKSGMLRLRQAPGVANIMLLTSLGSLGCGSRGYLQKNKLIKNKNVQKNMNIPHIQYGC